MEKLNQSPLGRKQSRDQHPRLWSLLLIGFVCISILSATFALYRYISDNEHRHQVSIANAKLSEVISTLEQFNQSGEKQLTWLSAQLSRYPNLEERLWLSFSSDLMKLFPRFKKASWLDQSGNIIWASGNALYSSNKLHSIASKLSSIAIWPGYTLSKNNEQISITMMMESKRENVLLGYLTVEYSLTSLLSEFENTLLTDSQVLVTKIDTPDDPVESGNIFSYRTVGFGKETVKLGIIQTVPPYPSLTSPQMLVFVAGIAAATIVSIILYNLEISLINKRELKDKVGALTTEINEISDRENYLQFIALYDPKTLLPNRYSLQQYLVKALAVEKELVLSCIEITNLNEIKDMFGKHISEQLLESIVKRFRAVVPKNAMLARVESSQFMTSVAGMCQLEAEMQASQLKVCLEEEIHIDENLIIANCVIGIACRYDQSTTSGELQGFAETAVHQARKLGSGGIVTYNQVMQEDLQQLRIVEQSLRKAINQDNLDIQFQPQIDMKTFHLTGIEARVCWTSHQGNIIEAQKINAVAEETGLMRNLGEWIIDRALSEYSYMLDKRSAPSTISVNLSGRQFHNGLLADHLLQTIRRYDVPAARVQVTLDEQTLLEHVQDNLDVLYRLRLTGLTIIIDNFGMGYSSLTCLKQYPIDMIKIDKSLITDVENSEDNLVICQTMISMANILSLDVIAEGVESMQQHQILRNLGCLIGQGSYYFQEMDTESILNIIREQRTNQLYPRA
ncbi:putative bifunctional diguanylate cyclase/phosphodiesterase [Veronia pacifica]|uniref:Diguanylate cyclase n=1 Tax=Veronia pacifica TaxID=1080227 RepID=A0A1C3EMV2_9GAMM|nr:bifunctional diguanylate cyclase/phosphodiesterase [Veronia pacifica]ODA34564.1 hypothetical protein A8L45_06240 [Veronia pacifica]